MTVVIRPAVGRRFFRPKRGSVSDAIIGALRFDSAGPSWLVREGMYIEQLTVIVDDYDEAIHFYVKVLGFELIEDSPSVTGEGQPKRWVVVRPPGASTGVLLAQADGRRQRAAVGAQFAGRVGLFLRVEDFEACYERLRDAGVRFVTAPRQESYGHVAVFCDVAGNRWDLLGPGSFR